MIFLQLFLFIFTALSVGARFSVHQPIHNFMFKNGGGFTFFLGIDKPDREKALRSTLKTKPPMKDKPKRLEFID